jgi:hypothetical protein
VRSSSPVNKALESMKSHQPISCVQYDMIGLWRDYSELEYFGSSEWKCGKKVVVIHPLHVSIVSDCFELQSLLHFSPCIDRPYFLDNPFSIRIVEVV